MGFLTIAKFGNMHKWRSIDMWEIFKYLCESRGVSAYKVSKDTGIPQPTFSEWKKGKYTPKIEKMKIIADYFGVSIDYLMTGKEKSPDGKSELDEKLSLLKNIMDSLSEDDRDDVLQYAEYKASKRKK